MSSHVIGYARVSTKDQSLDSQLHNLKEYGCTKIFNEKATGANSERKALSEMLGFIREGDVLVLTKLDRLARSSIDLGKIAETLQGKGVDLVVLDQKIDTTTPAGKLMFTMIGAFAEFERDLIHERCQEGIARARVNGVRFGRPKKLSDSQLQRLKLEFDDGCIGKADLAKKFNISRPTLYRLMKAS